MSNGRDMFKGATNNPAYEPRYSEIATFMRCPHKPDLKDVDIAIVGIPFDEATGTRPGARFGPRALRDASIMTRQIHHVTRFNPYDSCRVADGGDIRFNHIHNVEGCHTDITSYVAGLVERGITPLFAGGDHSVTYPIVRAIGAERPVAIVHFDAHSDTVGEVRGSKFHHGCPFYLGVEEGFMVPEKIIQIGIRGTQNFADQWDYPKDKGFRVVFIEEVYELGIQGVIDEIHRVVGDMPVYLSFDIDAIDPAFAPGTGTPEIGGLLSREAQQILRGCRGLDIVGADLVEVSPQWDPSDSTALIGATLMYEILCLLAEARLARVSRGSAP
ncbi:agmatinase [Cribrihabitans marinus]|uniref:Agmatinase n=1 Tax=Cribrihabitans marinus TaxID=1227549 RepID=A0A1H7E248_9RHOB|nr:agmatinase [Cribrihabitans marinus]GGH40020.1 guanidinopropionase [Cribrihabitans marinus]SEK04645.1 agmatinase [Cribrihabitans marinus]